MTISGGAASLAVVCAFAAPYILEAVKAGAGETVKSLFGRKAAARDDAHKTHDELRADIDAEREDHRKTKAELAAAKAAENEWREKCFGLQKENLEFIRANVNLETDLKAILKGGLTK